MTAFNEDTRVKIPATIQAMRIGYDYQSLNDEDLNIDFKTKEFVEKYKDDGILWFLESCDLTPLDMRRAFWQLREAGWFEHASGFLIGRPLHFGEEMMGVDQYNAVTDVLRDLNLPILMDLDIGHLPPMMPIICGSTATVKVWDQKIRIRYTYE